MQQVLSCTEKSLAFILREVKQHQDCVSRSSDITLLMFKKDKSGSYMEHKLESAKQEIKRLVEDKIRI